LREKLKTAPIASRKSLPSKSPRLGTSTTETQTVKREEPTIIGKRYLMKLVLQPPLPKRKTSLSGDALMRFWISFGAFSRDFK
jgi:hypothetical protein